MTALLLRYWKWAALVILVLSLFGSLWVIKRLNDERLRHKDNYNSSVSEAVQWRDKYDRDHYKVQEVHLKLSQLRNSKDSEIEDMKQRFDLTKRQLRKTESLLLIERQTTDTVTLALHDTTVVIRTDTVHAMAAKFFDGFLNVEAIVTKDSLYATYDYRDEILIMATWKRNPDAFFLWRWVGFARKIYSAEIVSSNPKSATIAAKKITVKKGRTKK